MQQTSHAKPSRYVRSRCERLVELAIDVSRDILSKGDRSSQGSTLYPRSKDAVEKILLNDGREIGYVKIEQG